MARVPRSTKLARVAPWANVGLLLLAVIVMALLAWRTHQAATAHRSIAEQTLREYAAFAAFELKNATLSVLLNQHRLALGPVMRWSMVRPNPLEPDEVADYVRGQAAACRCLDGARFFYRVTFADSTISTTPAPLATSQALRWFRDTIITHAIDAAPDERPVPRRQFGAAPPPSRDDRSAVRHGR